MREFYAELSVLLSYPRNIVLLLSRLAVAYGFIQPATMKLHDIHGTAHFFESLGIPFAGVFAYVVPTLETVGVALLVLGLFTRIISLFLAAIMVVAIFTVHLPNGFSVVNNGFEIPLYYLIFSLIFAGFGAGKYSMDHLLFEGDDHE